MMKDISREFATRTNIRQYVNNNDDASLQQDRVLYTILDGVAEDIIRAPGGAWKRKQALLALLLQQCNEAGKHKEAELILQLLGTTAMKTIHKFFWQSLMSSVHRILVEVRLCDLPIIEDYQQQSYILLEYFLRRYDDAKMALLTINQPSTADWIRKIINKNDYINK